MKNRSTVESDGRSRPAPPTRSDLLRTFIAVELDAAARRQLQSLQAALQARVAPGLVRWVALENIHITLKFLGETRPEQAPVVAAALDSIGSMLAPFQVTLAGRGCFPNFKRPHVIWAGLVDHGQRLQKLAEAVEKSVAPLGWPTDARPFSPHLTLGRVNDHATSRERADLGAVIEALEVGELSRLPVSTLYFMRSELQPGGPRYTVLREVKLGAT